MYLAKPIFFLLISFSFFNAATLVASQRAKGLVKLCVQCHGEQGEGMELVKAPAIAGQPAWYIMAQLEKFQNGARGGHPKDIIGMRMRPMAKTLRRKEDMQLVADYISNMPAPNVGHSVAGKAFRGEKPYRVCVACHGAKGEGNQALNAPPLTGLNDWYIVAQLQKFKAGYRGWDASLDPTGASMAPMSLILDEQGMKDVANYIKTLR